MNKILSTFLLSTLVGTLSAQQVMNKWSVGASIGVHDGHAPSAVHTKIYQFHHYGLNGRYMLNNRVGVMLDVGYDLLDAYGTGKRDIHYWRTSIQGVVNAGDLLKINSISDRIGFLVHAGAGISSMWVGKKYRTSENPTDPLFKEVDDMLNFIFGARPQFSLTDQISLNADLSFIFHHAQTYQFDMNNRSKYGAIDGYFLNLSLGASYYFGVKPKHADFVFTEYGGGQQTDLSEYDRLMKEFNDKTRDDDKDGVPNYVDEEENTPSGSYVDSKGIAIKDSDGDGLTDEFDLCPNEKGAFSMDGCPDSDGDGIGDNKDKCKTVPGVWNNQGCPEISVEVKEIMLRALKDVQFETGKDILLKESFAALDQVVTVLNRHPEYKLSIEGHTDVVGLPADNKILSEKRAWSAAAYLVTKGIDQKRLLVKGYGETRPKADNDTERGRSLNRRVEFNIVF